MKRNVGLGLAFIALAFFMILNVLGYFPDVNITRLVITILIVIIMINCLLKLEFFGVFVPASILVIIYKYELSIVNVGNLYIVLIGLFLALGFSILFKRKREHPYYYEQHDNYYHQRSKDYETHNESNVYEDRKTNMDNQDEIFYDSKFASTTRFVKSNNLEKLTINNSFGHLSVYLENATLSKNGAIIDINNSFGEVKLYIPKEYRINDNIEVILGNVSIKSSIQPEFIENNITLTGHVSLGNVDIILI